MRLELVLMNAEGHEAIREPETSKPSWPLFFVASGLSLSVGFFVPIIFEWGQPIAARSRHPKLVLAIVIVVVSTATLSLLHVWAAHHLFATRTDSMKKNVQWSIFDLIVATTIVAVVMALRTEHWPMYLLIAGITYWSLRQPAAIRERMLATLAVAYFPFVWMIAYNKPFGYTSGLASEIPLAPSMMPIRFMLGMMRSWSSPSVRIVATSSVFFELAIGVWLARRFPRTSLAYIVACFVASTLGSLLIHVLYRA